MLPLDEGFILVLPEPSPGTPGCRWWEGTAPGSVIVTWQSPWQCHCHLAEPAGSVSC